MYIVESLLKNIKATGNPNIAAILEAVDGLSSDEQKIVLESSYTGLTPEERKSLTTEERKVIIGDLVRSRLMPGIG